jgi:hypothetical protein
MSSRHRSALAEGRESDASIATLLPGEERLPMFSLGFTDSANNSRRLFAGLIPVGRREAYVGAAFASDPASGSASGGGTSVADAGPDTRVLQFALQVAGPWSELIDFAQMQHTKFLDWPINKHGDAGDSNDQKAKELIAAREGAQPTSWYVILDLVRFLRVHLTRVWEVIADTRVRSDLTTEEEALLAYLESIALKPAYVTELLDSVRQYVAGRELQDRVLSSDRGYNTSDVPANLKLALAAIAGDASIENNLENAELPFTYYKPEPEWPRFLFPLADPGVTGPFPFRMNGQDMTDAGNTLDTLTALVEAALPERSLSPQPEIGIPTEMKHADVDAWFAIRCVYEHPNCGPLDPPLLSAPTEAFQMAGFFDPEAPARQVRIPMPLNITPAALRRYSKSATLVMSDMLCGQLKRIRQLTLGDLVLSVLPWPFHKDLPNPDGPAGRCSEGGTLCSLSIPIVTLCALILLLIIVALFNMFFWWLPLLFLCFQVPGFGPKK